MSTNNKIIGITGGIGSGKSVVAKVLISMGYPVYNSDIEAKELINSNTELINQIKKEFGEDIYSSEGLDRKKMASVVFSNTNKLAKLNSLVHPAVGKNFDNWVNKQKTKLVFKEAAILFEIGIYKSLDATILVTAPIEKRISRVMQRDSVKAEEVENRMKNQWNDEEKIKLADFVIDNSGEVMVIPQVKETLTNLQIL